MLKIFASALSLAIVNGQFTSQPAILAEPSFDAGFIDAKPVETEETSCITQSKQVAGASSPDGLYFNDESDLLDSLSTYQLRVSEL